MKKVNNSYKKIEFEGFKIIYSPKMIIIESGYFKVCYKVGSQQHFLLFKLCEEAIAEKDESKAILRISSQTVNVFLFHLTNPDFVRMQLDAMNKFVSENALKEESDEDKEWLDSKVEGDK